MAERLYSTRQVADLLGLPHETILGWIQGGRLASERAPEGTVRVSETHLVRFLKDRGIDLAEIMARALSLEAEAQAAPASADARPDETGRGTPALLVASQKDAGPCIAPPQAPPPAAAPDPADPAAAALDAILRDAVRRGAASIHLESQADGLTLALRIDGRLCEKPNFKAQLPQDLRTRLVARCKQVAGLNPADTDRPQHTSAAVQWNGGACRLRVWTYPTALGEDVTIEMQQP